MVVCANGTKGATPIHLGDCLENGGFACRLVW
jgi:hypothetical protein